MKFAGKNIINVLHPLIVQYQQEKLNNKITKKIIMNDPNCSNINTDYMYFMTGFLCDILNNKGGFQFLYKLLDKSKIPKNEISHFLYTFLKLKQKIKKKLWSYTELEELQIPLELIDKTTNSYTII